MCISTAPILYAPNAFTKNGDNLNELFQLGGVFVDTYSIKIFSRYGDLLFESNDIHQSWDGTFRGKTCPPDVYIYMAEGTGRKSQRTTVQGTITLIR
jgi:gliding motility-associated-like protein